MMRGLTRVPIPVPDHLEAALGYDGKGRCLAIWWENDECMWSNSQPTTQGYWRGFLTYTEHPWVAPYLMRYDLGDCDTPGVHYLMFDLVERVAYIGPDWEVTQFLKENTPQRNLTTEQMAKLRELRRAQASTVDVVAIEQEAKRRTEVVNAMWEELNGC